VKLAPCKHLDYTAGRYAADIELRTCAPDFPEVRFWRRGPVWTACGGAQNVQFCGKGHGRINAIFDCYEPGTKSCYEPEPGVSL
jgi:hypothetical protein